jgi:hypothetical protein
MVGFMSTFVKIASQAKAETIEHYTQSNFAILHLNVTARSDASVGFSGEPPSQAT